MATTTGNLQLTKPAYSDAADISVINSNMDTIDSHVTALETLTSTHTSQISSLQDSVGKIGIYANTQYVAFGKYATPDWQAEFSQKDGTRAQLVATSEQLKYSYYNGSSWSTPWSFDPRFFHYDFGDFTNTTFQLFINALGKSVLNIGTTTRPFGIIGRGRWLSHYGFMCIAEAYSHEFVHLIVTTNDNGTIAAGCYNNNTGITTYKTHNGV